MTIKLLISQFPLRDRDWRKAQHAANAKKKEIKIRSRKNHKRLSACKSAQTTKQVPFFLPFSLQCNALDIAAIECAVHKNCEWKMRMEKRAKKSYNDSFFISSVFLLFLLMVFFHVCISKRKRRLEELWRLSVRAGSWKQVLQLSIR